MASQMAAPSKKHLQHSTIQYNTIRMDGMRDNAEINRIHCTCDIDHQIDERVFKLAYLSIGSIIGAKTV
jgi:hypothetical protein